MFVFGFCILLAQGGIFSYLTKIGITDIEEACQKSPEEILDIRKNAEMGWLIAPFAEMANDYDKYSETMLDKIMCTETCPCFKGTGGGF